MSTEPKLTFICERKKTTGLFSITKETEFQNSVPGQTAFSLIPRFYTICSGQKGNLMGKGHLPVLLSLCLTCL